MKKAIGRAGTLAPDDVAELIRRWTEIIEQGDASDVEKEPLDAAARRRAEFIGSVEVVETEDRKRKMTTKHHTLTIGADRQNVTKVERSCRNRNRL